VDSAAWNGCFGTGRERARASGKSLRRYYYEVALPEYQAKVTRALRAPKLGELF
jgi:hypothetical protein